MSAIRRRNEMQNKYKKPAGSYISFMSNKVKIYGGINLAQGIPGFNPPKELTQILSRIATENIHQYAPGNGNNELLDLLLSKYQPEFTNYSLSKDDILVTQGGTEALSLLYTYFSKTLQKPFAALAFDPVYESYKYLPGIFNSDFVSFSFDDDFSIDFEKLEKTCSDNDVKVIFLGSPGNPFGKIWSKQEMNSLIELSKRNDIFVVLDAVYKELYFEEKPYIPVDKFNPNLFYTNSFSKLFSITGWRIGYLIAHPDHMTKIKSIHDYTGLCAPSVLQQAVVEFLKKYDFGSGYVSNLRDKLTESFNYLSSELINLGFEIPETKGGYFVWAKLPEKYDDGFKFAVDLYDEQQVAVIPGEHFSEKATSYIRFNIAREKQEVDEGIKRIKKFFNI